MTRKSRAAFVPRGKGPRPMTVSYACEACGLRGVVTGGHNRSEARRRHARKCGEILRFVPVGRVKA